MKKGFIVLCFAAASVPSFGSSIYQGYDTACFSYGSGCTLTSSESGTGLDINSNSFLTYTPDSGFSTNGPTAALGTFSVSPALLGGDLGSTFDVEITFTAPADSGGQEYTADASGYVVLDKYGNADITFNNPTTQVYDGGAFEVSLPSSTIVVDPGSTFTLDATITPLTATPEPASVATFGAGLMLVGIAVFRRRAAKTVGV